jgi:hypothetical protein
MTGQSPSPEVIDRVRQLVAKGWVDPEIGPRLQKLAKTMYPEIETPDDVLAPSLAPLKKENAELKAGLDRITKLLEDRAKQDEQDSQARLDAKFAENVSAARRKYNLTDEGAAKMLDHMKATGNYSDPMGAAAFIATENPPPTPLNGPVFGPQLLNFAGTSDENPDYKLLHQDPGKYFDGEVRKMLSNPRDYVARELGEFEAMRAFGR